ncbi:MAG: FAD-binding protein [Ignavibacteriales bacterium]|nr:FAD-binding protein [Ignavibacteriales bacterium]
MVRDLITGELDRLRRQGHRDRHRRRRPALPRHHQRGDLRGHRPRDRAGDRRGRARQHGGGAVPPDRHLPGRHPRHRGLPRRRRPAEGRRRPPLHARLRAGEEGTRLARRRLAPHGGAHRARARARSRASASTSGSTSRCSASSTSSTTCARSSRSATTSSASTRSKDMIPVRPAQHYTMGGVRTDHTGESPTLKGLFAAGEAACWDMHGFNRLGGNSVAETVVAGMIVGEFIADFCDKPENDVDIPTGWCARLRRSASRRKLDALLHGSGTEDAERAQGARCRRS